MASAEGWTMSTLLDVYRSAKLGRPLSAPPRTQPLFDVVDARHVVVPREALLEGLLDHVADRVASKLHRDEPRADDLVSTRDNPLGARAFRDAARAGAFPVVRVKRMLHARRTDVLAWMASRAEARFAPPKPRHEAATTKNEPVETWSLAEFGLVPTKRGERKKGVR